jgi:hypothetical protein
MLSSTASLLLIGGFLHGAVSAARIMPRDGPSPALPYADDTSKYCSWWLDYTSVGSCADMLEANYIILEEFRRWVRIRLPTCFKTMLTKHTEPFCQCGLWKPDGRKVVLRRDPTNLFLKVNTAANLYARRLPNSTEVWVLCHFTQTTERDSIYTLLSYAAGVQSAAEMQQFQPYTLSWTVWDSYDNFVNTTFKSLN